LMQTPSLTVKKGRHWVQVALSVQAKQLFPQARQVTLSR
jgi:hypothetical protein